MPSKSQYEINKLRGKLQTSQLVYQGNLAALRDILTKHNLIIESLDSIIQKQTQPKFSQVISEVEAFKNSLNAKFKTLYDETLINVNNNIANIATNVSNIGTNTTNIATNVTNIDNIFYPVEIHRKLDTEWSRTGYDYATVYTYTLVPTGTFDLRVRVYGYKTIAGCTSGIGVAVNGTLQDTGSVRYTYKTLHVWDDIHVTTGDSIQLQLKNQSCSGTTKGKDLYIEITKFY